MASEIHDGPPPEFTVPPGGDPVAALRDYVRAYGGRRMIAEMHEAMNARQSVIPIEIQPLDDREVHPALYGLDDGEKQDVLDVATLTNRVAFHAGDVTVSPLTKGERASLMVRLLAAHTTDGYVYGDRVMRSALEMGVSREDLALAVECLVLLLDAIYAGVLQDKKLWPEGAPRG